MTNVQITGRPLYSGVVLALSLAAALNLVVPVAHAQGLFDHAASSGGASEVINVNRRSFGINFRGGHAAGDTVGRQDSLTHMSLSPYFNTGPALLFADARLGRANKGGLTWSFGTGLRTYVEEWDVVTGANFYHSRDNITGALLQTWGIGVDVLTEDWEVRANYVEPNGVTSRVLSQTIDQSSAEFMGNNIIFSRIDTVAEALEKVDLEGGVKLPSGKFENVDLRGFFGVYRFNGVNVPKTTGWKTRLQAEVGDHLELGVGLNQDTLTETTVSFNAIVSFGGFKAQDYTRNSAIHRLADPVRRDLTVASLRTGLVVPGVVALDPTDGTPLRVIHVDVNDAIGPFDGTVENPFNSLTTGLAVPGSDVVFVHAGGIYNAAPDNMIDIAPGQDVLGEGLITAVSGDRIVETSVEVQDLGELILPSSPTFIASGETLARPTLSGAAGNAVTMRDNTRFGGFIVESAAGAGIMTNNDGGTIIKDVLIRNTVGDGIFLFDTVDTTTIIDTIITGTGGAALHVDGGIGSIGYVSTSTDLIPSFSNIENSSQQAVLIENMLAAGSVNTTGVTINDDGGTGIQIVNNLGDTIIDNAQLMNSTANGILVLNSGGTTTFRNTVQTTTMISGAAQESILIDGLGAGGQVTFQTLQIDGRNDAGIEIANNSGRVTFFDSVLIGTAAGGVSAAVSVSNSQAGAVTDFREALTILGGSGRGMEFLGNDVGSTFFAQGQVGISNTTLEGISFVGDASSAQFTGVTIESPNERGVSVQNSTGTLRFDGGTTINGATLAAVDIQNSEANVLFDAVTITGTFGTPGVASGVNLQNNIAGANNSAILSFGVLNFVPGDPQMTMPSGVALFGINNSDIRVTGGTISTIGTAAVDLEESNWLVRFDSVSSSASVENAIRLVNAVPPDDNQFLINDTTLATGPGTGGIISGSQLTAVQLQNAGQVTLRGMQFTGNASDIVVANSGLDETDDQFLEVEFSRFVDTVGRVLEAQNLSTLVFDDSSIDDGGTGFGPTTILLTYSERTNNPDTTIFDQFSNPYEVYMRRNIIDDTFDSTIEITSQAGATDAHLDVDITNNMITLEGGVVGFDETAVTVNWAGPSRIRLASNMTTLLGDDFAGNKMAFNINHNSTTDEMLLSVVNNRFVATDDGSIGLTVSTLGQSDILVDANSFTFGGVDATGMLFNLAADTEFFMTNNELRFDADGGNGAIFNLVNQPSTFTINNNLIGMVDDGALIEEGIRFLAVIGTPNLIGNQNNAVFLLNPNDAGAFIEIPFSFGGTANGQIIVNGIAVP